jgi:hypothetical protein
MRRGDLVKAELYFDNVAIIESVPIEGLTGVFVRTISGTRMWVNKREIEVLNKCQENVKSDKLSLQSPSQRVTL